MLELQQYSNVSALFFFQNEGNLEICRYVKEWKAITMDVLKMLGELRHEREQIEEAILTLERLIQGRTKRRGRPPAWMATVKRRGRPPGSKNKVKEIAAA
jgi:hypothetical protein